MFLHPKFLITLCLTFCVLCPTFADHATLTVDLTKSSAQISPSLYGIFFEEINHAGDGGLYAELVRNRSFEDADTPVDWTLVTSGGAQGSMVIDNSQPLNAKNRRALRLEVTEPAQGRVGIANGGYWGIAVRAGKQYRLSLHARCSDGFAGALTVSLENAAGAVYAQTRIEGLTPRWQKFNATLTSTATDPTARLIISMTSKGVVWLDVVSLFLAEMWKGRASGLRPDLAQMLADLKPSFVRFPGGCFCEGDRLANAFRWKQTIGDIAERPGHWNLWGYRSTDGLGYHEYLQMCEDLSAEPMFVINCGMAHRDHVPMEQMDEWVQDALDAIEYANGPVTSQWGALRAKHGHPAPFNLRLIEIGNENGGRLYEERYALFFKAIKERYPNVQIIANVPVRGAPMDIVDEHYYNNPEWFISNAHRYDRYDRKGAKIYVGEYAVTQGCGTGNLRAALAEAAFMTGMERNSDVVIMASYAPLFVNAHDRKWNPDLICFDTANVYGTPSYYAQKLFSQHRGDVVLPVSVTTENKPVLAPRGSIGLATWVTQAEFKDVKVTRGNETLFAADFAKGADGWRVVRGDWKIKDGVYQQLSTQPDIRSVAGDPNWTDYTLSLKARKLGGAEGFLIMFRVRDDNNWYWWNLGGWSNVKHAIEKCAGGGKSIISNEAPGRIETGRWYDIRVDVQGNHIRCTLDGQLIHDVTEPAPSPLHVVASRVNATREIILKVVNVSDMLQDTAINLQGASKLSPEGTAIVLTAHSPDDENSFSQPTRVAPVTQTVKGIAAQFHYTFPPNSLTVLRLREMN